jgi:uroporphyrinogen-III synthase
MVTNDNKKTMKYKKEMARYLRKNLTFGEKVLWELLRNKNFEGLRFRRQHPKDNYIVDFYCKEKSLIIEIDGPLHEEEERKLKDTIREIYLQKKGYRILRFRDKELLGNTDDILQRIKKFIEKT